MAGSRLRLVSPVVTRRTRIAVREQLANGGHSATQQSDSMIIRRQDPAPPTEPLIERVVQAALRCCQAFRPPWTRRSPRPLGDDSRLPRRL
jgi:hypothetical protein